MKSEVRALALAQRGALVVEGFCDRFRGFGDRKGLGRFFLERRRVNGVGPGAKIAPEDRRGAPKAGHAVGGDCARSGRWIGRRRRWRLTSFYVVLY